MIDYMVEYTNWTTLGDTGRLRRFKSLFRYIGTNKSTVQRTTAKNQTALVKKVPYFAWFHIYIHTNLK